MSKRWLSVHKKGTCDEPDKTFMAENFSSGPETERHTPDGTLKV